MEPFQRNEADIFNIKNEKPPSTKTIVVTEDSIVDFTEGDLENPLNWTSLQKWSIAIAVASLNLIRYSLKNLFRRQREEVNLTTSVLATCAIIPAAPQALKALHSNSALYRTLLVSIWELGEGISPFFVAPLSERYGRLSIFYVGNALAVVWGIASAVSVDISMLVAFRFLSGCANTALTLAACIIGDLFVVEQRGKAMAMAMEMQIIGNFIAPICGAFIAEALGWRWTIWINVILFGAIGGICLLVIRETYVVQILKMKTIRLRQTTGNKNLQSKYQAQVDATIFLEGLLTPLRIVVLSPTIALISTYTAIAYGSSYIVSTTLTEIMESRYSFPRGTVGLAFLAGAIGNIVGMLFYGGTSDAYIKYRKKREEASFRVEHRLLHLIVGAVLLPLGFFVYGWTLEYSVHWIVPLISTGVVGLCGTIIIVSTENYLIDAYSVQSASAIAAGVILRAIAGAVYPLTGPPLYASIGLGWGNTLLAFVLLLFLPFLVLLVRYGDKMRVKDQYADRSR